MPKEIYLVKVGMTMTEGMVSEWYVADGAAVKKGELVYALETEKVNLDVDAEADGIVKHAVDPGVMLAPGDVVGYIYLAGEDVPDGKLASASASEPVETPLIASEVSQGESKVHPEPSDSAPAPVVAESADGRLKSSPAARRLAGELGVTLSLVRGSGPGGRIVERDVQAASTASPARVLPTPSPSAVSNLPATEVLASPLAKRLAAERGLNLAMIAGSGPLSLIHI